MGERSKPITAASIEFWDHYAKWYKLWMEHTRYHQMIVEVLKRMISPGWRVLDIGAGNGVLSIPLSYWGCHVTALEPSSGMRSLLEEEISEKKGKGLKIDERSWEAICPEELLDYDLIIACNSLHLTQIEFGEALEKVFQTGAKNIFFIYEIDSLSFQFIPFYKNYRLVFSGSYEVEDSFAYHNLGELLEHRSVFCRHITQSADMMDLRKKIFFREDHFWLKDTSQVMMSWWERIY